MKRDEVALREDVILRLGTLHAELAETLLRDERVVADDAHLQTGGAPGDLLPDAAEAEDAERLVRQLEPAVAGALPASFLERRMRLRDVAREGEQQPDRVLGGGDDGRLGRVRDDDPLRVAASMSTLSTPTPARPITLSRSARSISRRSAWSPSG